MPDFLEQAVEYLEEAADLVVEENDVSSFTDYLVAVAQVRAIVALVHAVRGVAEMLDPQR